MSSEWQLDLQSLLTLLGEPPVKSEQNFDELQQQWGICFPEEFVEAAKRFGDSMVSGFIFVCGPRTLKSYAERMGRRMGSNRRVPLPVLPSAGGMLLWGNTLEGDQLFLVNRGAGRWTVSAFRRNWDDWYESNLGFAKWLHGTLVGEVAADWLPEWPPVHEIEPYADH